MDKKKCRDKRWVDQYTSDYNIFEVHDWILYTYGQNKKQSLDAWKKEYSDLRLAVQKPQTVIERNESIRRIRELRTKIDEYTNDALLDAYQKEIAPVLDAYRQVGPTQKTVAFGSKKRKEQEREEDSEERRAIIDNFFRIAKKYAEVEVVRYVPPTDNCNNCGFDLSGYSVDENGVLVCPECGVQRICPFKGIQNRDSKLTMVKNGYDDRDNFYKALLRYQGKNLTKSSVSYRSGNASSLNHLFDTLDRYFKDYGLPTGEEVRSMPVNEKGGKDGTSREMMMKALADTNNSKQYTNLNWLCHVYWGYSLPDSSCLEDTIMRHYDSTQKIYDAISKDRKSSLNIQYRLFKHLELVGHPCKKEDFKMVETRDILEYHDETWKEMCEGTGLPFYPTI